MNRNSILTNVSAALSIEQEMADKLADEMIQIMSEQIIGGNSIAVPGFGQFDTVSKPEQIVNDLSTGKRIMLPPVIEVVFTPATAITKETNR